MTNFPQEKVKNQTKIETSVIIVNYNSHDLLSQCIQNLLKSLGAEKQEFIIVDNASTDNSITNIRNSSFFDKVILIQNKKNLGFAAACNQGAVRSTGQRLLFLNPDCFIEKNTIAQLNETLSANPKAGMCGPLILNPDGTEQQGCRRNIPDFRSSFYYFSGLHKFNPKKFPNFNFNTTEIPKETTPVPAISGACLLMKREIFNQIDGWDEHYFIHVEDLDLCKRVTDAGYTILFNPQAKATHIKGACSKKTFLRVVWHKHIGFIYFYNKFQSHDHNFLQRTGIKMCIMGNFVYQTIFYAIPVHIKNFFES